MIKILAALFISLSATSSIWATPIYDAGSGHYYDVIFASSITWDDARAAALAQSYLGLQGHLATITSAVEDGFVGTAVAAAGPGEFWAGGYQAASAGDVINNA